MLATFHGVVEHGQIRWIGIAPPDGAKVVVVSHELPSVEEQLARLDAMPREERERMFDEFVQFSRQHPAEADISELNDQELVDAVHEVRAEMRAEKERVAHS